jgi:hypothetical protein
MTSRTSFLLELVPTVTLDVKSERWKWECRIGWKENDGRTGNFSTTVNYVIYELRVSKWCETPITTSSLSARLTNVSVVDLGMPSLPALLCTHGWVTRKRASTVVSIYETHFL